MTATSPKSETAISASRRFPSLLLFGSLLAVAVISGLTAFGDIRQLGDAFRQFTWWLALPILVLVLANYALRFLRWEGYLRLLAVPAVPRPTSLLIFIAGFGMALTPGKVGEVIKCLYLRRLTGVAVGRTGAIIAVERITDGLAMLVLASIGLTQFTYGRPLLASAAIGALVVVLLLRRPHFLSSLLARGAHLPLVGRTVEHAVSFVHASHRLLAPRPLTGAVALGAVAWAGECVAFFLVLVGLGLDPSWHLLLVATFVLAVSSVIGGISMLPGGLGVSDASIAAMLVVLLPVSIDRGTAVAATLLIRFATLWFSVLIGVGASAILQRRLAITHPRPTFVGAHHGADLVGEAR